MPHASRCRQSFRLGGLLGLSFSLFGCSVEDVSSAPIESPFAVSDYFVPSGYMGDGSHAERTPKPLDLSYDGCRPRPAKARGNCYRIVYRPLPTDDGGVGWAGLYWQSPANNWGQDRPQTVAPNAARISFFAAGEAGGENFTALVGGLEGTDPDGAPLPYADTFAASADFVLTTELTRYEVPLPPEADIRYVLGAFGFSLAADGAVSRTIFLDDITWLEE